MRDLQEYGAGVSNSHSNQERTKALLALTAPVASQEANMISAV